MGRTWRMYRAAPLHGLLHAKRHLRGYSKELAAALEVRNGHPRDCDCTFCRAHMFFYVLQWLSISVQATRRVGEGVGVSRRRGARRRTAVRVGVVKGLAAYEGEPDAISIAVSEASGAIAERLVIAVHRSLSWSRCNA